MRQQTPLRASPRSTLPQQTGTRLGGRGANQSEAVESRLRTAEDQALGERSEPAQPEQGVASRLKFKLKPPMPVNMPRTPFIVLVIMVVVAGVMGILVLNSKINSNAFKIDDLKASQNELDLRQQQLERFIAQQETPGSLAAAAAKLGLTDPGPPAFISLPDGKIIGVPKPASGPTSITSQ